MKTHSSRLGVIVAPNKGLNRPYLLVYVSNTIGQRGENKLSIFLVVKQKKRDNF